MKTKIKSVFRIRDGFTLIELLIVVAIIGVLSTFLMTNFIGVRQRARDAQRKSDLRQLQSALEMYRADQGTYPANLTNCGGTFSSGTQVYMQTVPCDPLNTYNGGNYFYYDSNSQANYCLISCLENGADSQGKTAAQVNAVTQCNGSAFPQQNCASAAYYVVINP